MSGLESYKLTHPELLSDYQLREILRNSYIEIPNFESLSKNELLEIYKRIAMPLPQRQHGDAKDMDTEVNMISEKPVTSIKVSDTYNLTASLNRGKRQVSQMSSNQADKLKPINDQKLMSKKIRLCSIPKVEVMCNGIIKRKCDERNEEPLIKKRQKITWP